MLVKIRGCIVWKKGSLRMDTGTEVIRTVRVGVGIDEYGVGVDFEGPWDAEEIGEFSLKSWFLGLPVVTN